MSYRRGDYKKAGNSKEYQRIAEYFSEGGAGWDYALPLEDILRACYPAASEEKTREVRAALSRLVRNRKLRSHLSRGRRLWEANRSI